MKPSASITACSIIALCGISPELIAQTQPLVTPSVTILSDVAVTSRGIVESRADAPLTINVISGDTIDRRNLESVEESIRTTPGVEIHSGGDPAFNFMWIRGAGSINKTSMDDNSVGINIDGISQGITGLGQNLYDIEQIEVAKGPQGTLFGRNSSAGALNIKTTDPKPYAESSIGFGYGSDNNIRVSGIVNAPLSNDLSMRISGIWNQKDDYLRDRDTNEPLSQKQDQGIRAKMLWQPSDRSEWLFTAYHDERENYLPLMIVPPYAENPQYTKGTIPLEAKRRTNGFSSDFSHEWDTVQLNATTAYREHKGHVSRAAIAIDLLPTVYDLLQVPQPYRPLLDQYYANPDNNIQRQSDDIKTFSQELRLSSLPEQDIQWVAGAYLSRSNRDFRLNSVRGLLPVPQSQPIGADAYNANILREYQTDTQAIFGEVTAPVTDKLKAIGGLRLTHEEIDYDVNWQPNPSAVNPFAALGNRTDSQKLEETYLTGRVGLDYELTPEWHAYGLYSRGHKSGGFSDFDTNIAYGGRDNPYKPGTVDAFEIGLKGEADSGQWGASIAAFHIDTTDDKISVAKFAPVYTTESHNVDSRASGVEAEGFWQVSDHWQINAGLNYTNAKITKVPDIQQNVTAVGNRIPQVPRFSGSLGVEYQHPISIDGLISPNLVANLNVRHVGERAAEPHNRHMLDAYNLVDASIGIASDNLDISLWGKNLTNEKWQTYGMQQGATNVGMPAPGRSIGIDMEYRF